MSEEMKGDSQEDIHLSNEYAQVSIQKVRTKKGERLRITSPKLGHSIDLDPVELESLTWQHKSIFSEFLLTPYGPNESEEQDG